MVGTDSENPLIKKIKKSTGGAFGAGLVLVVLPCLALFYRIPELSDKPMIGLPILAIFGIMILFGALALISAVFARLGLQNPSEALALPEGSIRAAIALALIVLFAIISIMLYQSTSGPYKILSDLSTTDKDLIVKEPANRVMAVIPEKCADPCTAQTQRYSVHLASMQGQESTDLAKQLLILIGTLMTSVTSFYYASRAYSPPKSNDEPKSGTPAPDSPTPKLDAAGSTESHVDGCDLPIEKITPDDELPAASGGVA